MINKDAKLSEKIFKDVDMVPSRDGYGHGLVKLGKDDENIMVLGADLTDSTRAEWFRVEYPDRFVQIGIAEQDMMGVAAGLSLTGKIPFVSTYGVFCTGRAWDQLRTTICYPSLNVKLGSAHGGISVGPDGATHQALEDINLTRVLPNMVVLVPADAIEAKKATLASVKIDGPVFIRFGREKVPVITTEDTPYEVGKAQLFYDSGDDVSIFACGVMVYESLIAAKELEKEKIGVKVYNIHTIKPIDKDAIIDAAKKTNAIVTAEEHQVMAGFGSAVAEVVVENYPVPIKMVGVQDRFGESGGPDELMKAFNLVSADIIKAVKNCIEMKK